MDKPKTRKLHKSILVAYAKVRRNGGILHRQSSDTDEAVSKGGGYIYFVGGNSQPISPVAGRFLVEKEIVLGLSDGLFAGSSQSFEAIDAAKFDAFKARYEEVPMRLG